MFFFIRDKIFRFLGISQRGKESALYDSTLVWCSIGLASIGFIMVSSASMPIGLKFYQQPFHFAIREAVYLTLAFIAGVITLSLSMETWRKLSPILLLLAIFLLLVVLVAGSNIKGASRWIPLGLFNFQPAELAKLALFCFLANYLVRKADEVRYRLWGFVKPMCVMLILSILLLMQPDLGTVVVLFVTTLAVLFLAGAKLWQFFGLICTGIVVFIVLILKEEYRLRRFAGYWDPWKDPFNTGYQLSNSLMAIGNGGAWGQGLGNSVFKQEYLPEAHTDFIFSVIAEELGYIGVVLILILVFFVAFKAMSIGVQALKIEKRFSGFLACQIGVWFSFQSLVNVGVVSGLLPTKGLTLPLISYGGSSLLIMAIAIAILIRIDYETRQTLIQAHIRKTK